MNHLPPIVVGIVLASLPIMAFGQRGPIQCTAEVTVVDEDDRPVQGVKVIAGFSPGGAMGGAKRPQEALTDSEGKVTLTDQSIFPVSIHATKAGYYNSHTELPIYKEMKVGVYEPINNPKATLLLRAMRNPIPMYAKRIELISPENGTTIGYDFQAGDWVAPNGKGKIVDMYVLSELSQRGARDFDHTLSITFPNANDGIQDVFYEAPSEFKSGYVAPDTGYQQVWKYIRTRRPDQREKGNVNPHRNYLLRVRTKVDDAGNIQSANYVKFYGELPRFTYYFNPTPNDRNLEFDPDRNLFGELLRDELVVDP